ncbi:hypothetical protein VOLCADRAFT_104837 [Volvox carteri f. nagariensis]|uniref:WSC domain-containing protein n=1 Tax=Volvox carteri f. nagariensis TaxID=3068 RepID=D8TWF4_VOLCA|nr:uncharacterized protein VOLCADRAFT_104837 [Volvox carteri f. nagariensis]EFJ48037.1 hypothetical protein VOLCADRAFT_104837 [Volvox carteri f. nagariensis]|eukprot:XP_002950722.1 hypothetical protein VOLCADRAFT_104837 [Volvox carteri f. nagariensis]
MLFWGPQSASRYVAANNRTVFENTTEANITSYYLPLSTFLRGGHEKCDVYVIGSYDESFNDPDVQDFITSFVAMGKGIIVVGPDLMPSKFYAPDTPAVPAVPEPPVAQAAAKPQPQPQPDNSGHMGGGARGRRSLIGRYDGSTSNLLGAGATEETIMQMWEAEGADAVGSGYVIVRRSLQTGGDCQNPHAKARARLPPSPGPGNDLANKLNFNINRAKVNDPGGRLLQPGSPGGNGLEDAQKYLSYLKGQRNLTYNEICNIRDTIRWVKETVRPGTTSADALLQMMSDIEEEEKKRPMFPPFTRLAPPRRPPWYDPPSPRTPPSYLSRPPPLPANLPPNVRYVGCYSEFPKNGTPLLNKNVTVNACWNVSTSAYNAKAGYLIGMQKIRCYGAQLPSTDNLNSALSDTQCDAPCTDQPGLVCGSFGNSQGVPGSTAFAVYLLV